MLSTICALLTTLSVPSPAAGGGSNLIPNGDFESDATITCGAQGVLPAPWSGYFGSPDTYSESCTCLPGLDPNFPFGNFAAGFLAYDGCRFAAGWGVASEALRVQLSAPLVPGRTYRMRGAFTRGLVHTAGDPYDVYFSADNALDRTSDFLAGMIGKNTVQGAWTLDSFVFTATGAESYLFLDPHLGADCYIGVDGLVLEPVASAVARNGSGSNPSCYASQSAPMLGGSWKANVDTTGHTGANLTVIVGYASPKSGVFLKYGELLVDFASPRLFQASAVPMAGVGHYTFPIPNNSCLAGARAYTQAAVLGGGPRLCNAVDLTIGY